MANLTLRIVNRYMQNKGYNVLSYAKPDIQNNTLYTVVEAEHNQKPLRYILNVNLYSLTFLGEADQTCIKEDVDWRNFLMNEDADFANLIYHKSLTDIVWADQLIANLKAFDQKGENEQLASAKQELQFYKKASEQSLNFILQKQGSHLK